MIVTVRIDGRPVLNAELLDEDVDDLREMLAEHYVTADVIDCGQLLSSAEWREAEARAINMIGVARHPLEIVRRVLREVPPYRPRPSLERSPKEWRVLFGGISQDTLARRIKRGEIRVMRGGTTRLYAIDCRDLPPGVAE